MLAKFMNFLNGRPKLNNILTHLYKFFTSPLRGLAPGAGQARPRARKRYNCYNKNSYISRIKLHKPLKNLGLTFVLNKSFLVKNYSILSSTAESNGYSLTESCDSSGRRLKGGWNLGGPYPTGEMKNFCE